MNFEVLDEPDNFDSDNDVEELTETVCGGPARHIGYVNRRTGAKWEVVCGGPPRPIDDGVLIR